MKKAFIAAAFVLGTLAVSAQTTTGQQGNRTGQNKTRVTTDTTSTDTTSTRTRGLTKGSQQGQTSKATHRSTKSGGTKPTGQQRNNTDTTRQ